MDSQRKSGVVIIMTTSISINESLEIMTTTSLFLTEVEVVKISSDLLTNLLHS